MDITIAHVLSDSEDEIFFGEVTSLERRKAKLLQNRRTEIFKSPLLDQQQSSRMAPRDDAPKTYSKVPLIQKTTEAKRPQAVKQRPPPLPSFTQLYCSKDGQLLNSPFHVLTNTNHQTNKHCKYRSTQSIQPLPSPHMYSMPRASCHLLTVPSQHHRRICLSPGLSPSFFFDPFDKLLHNNGYESKEGYTTPVNITVANTSCSSIEDMMSPAGLLFCTPKISIDQRAVSKKKKKKDPYEGAPKRIISETSSSEKSNGGYTPNDISSSQMNQEDIRHTPDLFFTSSWVTRRNNYRKILVTPGIENSVIDNSDIGVKGKLHRSCSVPEIHIVHPEESDNSFMSQMSADFISNSKISSGLNHLSYDIDATSPTWLLTMASALNHSLSFSDTDKSCEQSPVSELGKTFDTVSTLTPIFSKHMAYNKKPLSSTLRGIVNKN